MKCTPKDCINEGYTSLGLTVINKFILSQFSGILHAQNSNNVLQTSPSAVKYYKFKLYLNRKEKSVEKYMIATVT